MPLYNYTFLDRDVRGFVKWAGILLATHWQEVVCTAESEQCYYTTKCPHDISTVTSAGLSVTCAESSVCLPETVLQGQLFPTACEFVSYCTKLYVFLLCFLPLVYSFLTDLNSQAEIKSFSRVYFDGFNRWTHTLRLRKFSWLFLVDPYRHPHLSRATAILISISVNWFCLLESWI